MVKERKKGTNQEISVRLANVRPVPTSQARREIKKHMCEGEKKARVTGARRKNPSESLRFGLKRNGFVGRTSYA